MLPTMNIPEYTFCRAHTLVLSLWVSLLSLTASAGDRPNIIYILADDLGYADLGVYGQTLIQTPNLDRMAAQGMRFTQHYSGSTVCAPSRSSLMTGQHAGRTPIRGNAEIQPEGQEPLPSEAVTLAEILQQAGYATGAFGKWGLGFVFTEGDPLHQGFDRFLVTIVSAWSSPTCSVLAFHFPGSLAAISTLRSVFEIPRTGRIKPSKSWLP